MTTRERAVWVATEMRMQGVRAVVDLIERAIVDATADLEQACSTKQECIDEFKIEREEHRRLRGVVREAVGKLTNLHCKTKRDQSRLCMAFDALYVEANR